MSLFLLLIACSGKTADTSTEPSSPDSPPEDTSPQLPEPPDAFTLNISGEATLSLNFDTPTCTIPDGAPNFYAFWRLASGEHKFVLKAELRNIYDGEGSYTEADGTVIKLQEEAGGEARFFQTKQDDGDTATVTIEGIADDLIWGSGNAPSLHSGTGNISLEPASFPIWCTEENTN